MTYQVMPSMENQPLITVIVPCYNVEKYMDKCISSIVGQVYSNLEILLIDDGSVDETGKICDAWQEKDTRIRVIHKQNEGLPYARKTGIENMTADYVAFVDSDDWIDANMYADMMTALLSTNSDIAQCDLCFVNEDGQTEHRVERHTGSVQTFGRIESVLTMLLDETWRMSFCTKIYKKSLFNNIAFPKGREWGEDYVNLELFHRTSQTVMIDSAYYFYFQRNNSMTKQGDLRKDLKTIGDMSDAYHERYTFVERHPEYHSALPYVKSASTCVGMLLLRNMVIYPQYCTKEYFYTKANQMSSISFTKEERLPQSYKIELYLLKLNAGCYKFLRTTYVWLIRVTNKLKITNKQTCYLISGIFWFTYNNFMREQTLNTNYQCPSRYFQ